MSQLEAAGRVLCWVILINKSAFQKKKGCSATTGVVRADHLLAIPFRDGPTKTQETAFVLLGGACWSYWGDI